MSVRACGIDPGSASWAIAFTGNAELEKYVEIPAKKVIEKPEKIVEIIRSFGDVDVVSAPSGYGLPLKKVKDLTEHDFEELLLKKKNEKNVIVGLGYALREIKSSGMNAFVLPGVKHLSTVPSYRKINKIDLGTPDKVCACAAAIKFFCEKNECAYEDAGFLFAEIGSAFNAFLAVDGGKITDGIGGSCASMGRKARGRVDAEIAYLIREKASVFSGGLKDVEKICENAEEAFLEGILKDLNSLRMSLNCRRVILSGKNVGELKRELELHGSDFEFEELVLGEGEIKAAAIGAALIADGVAGGRMKGLVETMKIREGRGSVLDLIA